MSEAEKSRAEQDNMILEAKADAPRDEDENANEEQRSLEVPTSKMMHDDVVKELLDHVADSQAIFKSQQKGEPELTFEEKRTIAEKLLAKSQCSFLAKFGHHLKVEHLEYFGDSEDYEMVFHVNRLRRYFNNSTRRIDVRNRRYEALKGLIEKGEYFSECEMMKRNPLLYEHLVGQYLTDEEKKARDSLDTRNTNYVDILMETVERDKLEKRLRSQQKEENEALEENDSDDDDDDNDDNDCGDADDSRDSVASDRTNSSSKQTYAQWGSLNDTKDESSRCKDKDKKLQSSKVQRKISNQEIQLLRQEFVTNMYQSFLDGKDKDFDYSTVDDNETYDNIELRNQDEEEKYFDSEAPETVLPSNEQNESESEDELDVYMRTLKVT